MKSAMLDELVRPESATRLRLLMLEYELQDAELMLLELRAYGFDVECKLTKNKQEFLAALQEGQFDAILADYRLPGWTGLGALKELRASGNDTPFLLVTGTIGEEAASARISNSRWSMAYSTRSRPTLRKSSSC